MFKTSGSHLAHYSLKGFHCTCIFMFSYVVHHQFIVLMLKPTVNSSVLYILIFGLFFFPPFQKEDEDEELCSVFVPTNHLYIGDIFLVNTKEIIRPNLSIREGIGMFYLV